MGAVEGVDHVFPPMQMTGFWVLVGARPLLRDAGVFLEYLECVPHRFPFVDIFYDLLALAGRVEEVDSSCEPMITARARMAFMSQSASSHELFSVSFPFLSS
jgi:hypothetical protein